MRYLALATDYDGTLAHDGVVDDATIAALERFLASGRRLLMVTGRELDDLQRVFNRLDLFEWLVVENGVLLYNPRTREEIQLGPDPPEAFLKALKGRGVPFSVGRSIVATWTPHETDVLECIRDLGMEAQVIFNKGAVMVLPSGMNKCTGMMDALKRIGLSPHNVVAIGDAENDHALIDAAECGAAVANALPMLKKHADIVTGSSRGAGVAELIEQVLADDLSSVAEVVTRRRNVLIGKPARGAEVRVPAYGPCVLVAGPSGAGKTPAAMGTVERLATAGYQFCCIDPEGDYEGFAGAVTTGDAETVPSVERVLETIADPADQAVVNLLAVRLQDRPQFFANLLPRLLELRATAGRPHWLLIDEAHHMMPTAWNPAPNIDTNELYSTLLVTVNPGGLATPVLDRVDILLAVGNPAGETFEAFCSALGIETPRVPKKKLEPGQAVFWDRRSEAPPKVLTLEPHVAERKRHRRKYAEGDLGSERSFYFRGPDVRLNLRAQNLAMFVQMAEGVDEETWRYHLDRGDITRWFRECVKDQGLADEARRLEGRHELPASESRRRITSAIEERFTLPS